MARHEASPYMSVKQAAAYWGLHENQIRSRIARGDLPAVRLSKRCLRLRRADVEALGQPVTAAHSA